MVAVNLVFEPIVGRLMKTELLARNAPRHGRMPGLEIVPVLSEPGPGWAGETGLVTDAVDRRLPRLSGYDAYLCGPPAMIGAAVELVTRRGVRPRNVCFDAFVPTG